VRHLLFICAGGVAIATGIAVASPASGIERERPGNSMAPVALETYSWTGPYIGANVGYGVSLDRTSHGRYVGGALNGGIEAFDIGPDGVIGGGQIGYNWQPALNFVLGIEADFQASGQTDSATCVSRCRVTGPSPAISQYMQRLPWFGTVRGRVGVTNGPTLFYVTAGWAYGRIETDISTTQIAGNTILTVNYREDKSGWTLGGGVESQVFGNWTAKVEYLYVDLGTINAQFLASNFNATFVTSSDIHNHVVRAGLNYSFGAPGADYPMAAPAPSANWSGFYVGGNAGYGIAANASGFVAQKPLIVYDTFDLVPRGAIAGGQIGFNWQFAPMWVAGIEADIQGSGQSARANCVTGCIPPPAPSAFLTQVDQTLSWFGTVRGRLGWTNGATLFYGTGGWAIGRITETLTTDLNAGGIYKAAFAYTRSGWTAGGGIETQLGNGWSAKAEYLYVDLGTFSDPVTYPTGSVPFILSSEFHDHIMRVGVNYNFGTR
jgi:outer membrane immunogenic protein